MKKIKNVSLIYWILIIGGVILCVALYNKYEIPNENLVAAETVRSLGQADVIDEISQPNILQVAITSKDHTTLVAAVQAAQIEHILVNAGPLTVFAPTNSAFDKLEKGTVENLLKKENINTLTNILTRHAAPGSYNIPQLKKEAKKRRKLYMANGDYLQVTVEDDEVYINGCKIVASIQTVNGIINVIEEVIL